jgi:probable addiction module antidote protein
MKRTPSVKHDESVIQELKNNPRLAAAYLQAAVEDSEEPAVLLVALRHVAAAQGMREVARRSQVERESLYRALSPKGNPRLSTVIAVLHSLDLCLRVEPRANLRKDGRRLRARRSSVRTRILRKP